jgi:hypothetical protein
MMMTMMMMMSLSDKSFLGVFDELFQSSRISIDPYALIKLVPSLLKWGEVVPNRSAKKGVWSF